MSDPWCTIRIMEKWYKYTYVCTGECDALIEYTMKAGYTPNEAKLTCLCGSATTLLSVADATIQPTNERNEMDIVTMNEYYPSQSVVLKQIIDEDMKFQAYKVTELETVIHDYKQRISSLTARLESQEKQIGLILDKLTADEWYSSNTDKAEVLSELCEILKHEPKQTIMITAQVNVEVSYDIPLDEVENFDAKYFLQDNLTIDSWHGDVMIESYDVEDADVNW
jgi:hypothetical protein